MGSIFRNEEKLAEQWYLWWQLVRRHPRYVEFCSKHIEHFTHGEYGMLDPIHLGDEGRKEYKAILEQFRLDSIIHPSAEIPRDEILQIPLFDFDSAVDPLTNKKKSAPDKYTPVFDGHFVHLKIDIRSFRTKNEILDGTWSCIEWARRIADIRKSLKRLPKEKQWKIWDLYQSGLRPREIIDVMWPEVANNPSLEERDRHFKALQDAYIKKGILDWEERAWNEAYEGESSSGIIKYFDRVKKARDRVEEAFKLID